MKYNWHRTFYQFGAIYWATEAANTTPGWWKIFCIISCFFLLMQSNISYDQL